MKAFDAWNTVKKKIEQRDTVPEFSERDIWWCSLGVNVGYETDGKHDTFERPVCIVRKFNKDVFIGLPLTSTRKDNPYYFHYTFHHTEGAIILSQGRLLSAKRLERKLGRIGSQKFKELRKRYRDLYA